MQISKVLIQSRLVFSLQRQFSNKIPSWATIDPYTVSAKNPYKMENLIDGKWTGSAAYTDLIDPVNGEVFIKSPDTKGAEFDGVVKSMNSCPKSGVFNPIKNCGQYAYYGDVSFRIAEEMRKPEVLAFLAQCINRVFPKSQTQAEFETIVTRKFFENFAGDGGRLLLCKSFNVPGDHEGQQSTGYRWPFGPVGVISPFNYPLEICGLQFYGALLAGNRVLVKSNAKVGMVMEQFLRLCIHCGMPAKDVNYVSSGRKEFEDLLDKVNLRVLQFTGSQEVAEKLSKKLGGKVRLEDAGYDWKVIGPGVHDIDYVAQTSDQDAYAISGQKCSCQSVLFVAEDWEKAGFFEKIKNLAAQRNWANRTISPVLSWTTKELLAHVDACLKIPGSKLLFGGKIPEGMEGIPKCYGTMTPTAVYVPIEQFDKHWDLCSLEVFGPFQIVTTYKAEQLDLVLEQLERFENHLTAGVVSQDIHFLNYVLGRTVNGVTYAGTRARTTGAPQNHFFGPAGDPRGAGIGTPEAINMTWTTHREIIKDVGPVDPNWKPFTPN